MAGVADRFRTSTVPPESGIPVNRVEACPTLIKSGSKVLNVEFQK